MQKKQSKDNSLLVQLETISCDNFLQYPYYPIVTTMMLNSITYIAFKSKESIVVFSVKDNICTRSHSFNLSLIGAKSFVTSILLVNPALIENMEKEENGTLFLLLGYYGGYLYLVKVFGKTVKILKKYNRNTDSDTGFFSKTLTFFSGSGTSDYQTWQPTTVIQIEIARKILSYLFRNGILVVVGKLSSNMEDLQKKYEWISSSKTQTSQNRMVKMDNYFYYCCSDYKLIRQGQRCIISFEESVSSYEMTDSSLFVGTYNGLLLQFETETYNCLRRISTLVAIKHLSVVKNYLVLCLQDDYTQLIDLHVNKYINLTGHSSFTACALPLGSSIFLASYDKSISITNPKIIKTWSKIQVKNNIEITYQTTPTTVQVDQKSQLKSEGGIGTGIISGNILVLSTFDNKIKIFRTSVEHLNS